MTGYTTPDGIPYPNDPAEPADLLTDLEDMAQGTQAAIDTVRAGAAATSHAHTGTYAPAAHGHGEYAAAAHSHAYAAPSHTHDDRYYTEGEVAYLLSQRAPLAYRENSYPGEGGINAWVWNIGTLTPGQEVEYTWGIPDGAYVMCTVQHHSTYIFAVANLISSTQVTVRCRNGTTATTHTNVKVHVWVLNPAN